MAGKRDNNAGSISKRDNKWRAQISTGRNPETGKLIRTSKTFTTKADAQKWITEQTGALNTGTYIAPSSYTVKTWCNEWLTVYKQNIKPNTRDSYDYVLKQFVYPNIGNIPIQKLTVLQVQKLINGMRDKVSSRTAAYTVTTLKSAFKKAVDIDLIPKNVINAVEKPKVVSKEARYLELEERFKLIEACLQERIGAAYILTLFAGLRRGECLGLRWCDINFTDGYISISQSLTRVSKQHDDGSKSKTEINIGTPKIDTSVRDIPIPPFVMRVLTAYKAMIDNEQKLAGKLYTYTGLAFCTELGGHIEPRNFERKFKSILHKAGIDDINLHGLRHTYATMLYELQINHLLVEVYMGHSNPSMNAHYTHLSKEEKRKGSDKLEEKYGHSVPESPE